MPSRRVSAASKKLSTSEAGRKLSVLLIFPRRTWAARAVGLQSASRTATAPIWRSSSGATTCGGARGAVRGCRRPAAFVAGPPMALACRPTPGSGPRGRGPCAPPQGGRCPQRCLRTLSASPSSSRGTAQPDPKPGRGAQLLSSQRLRPPGGRLACPCGFADAGDAVRRGPRAPLAPRAARRGPGSCGAGAPPRRPALPGRGGWGVVPGPASTFCGHPRCLPGAAPRAVSPLTGDNRLRTHEESAWRHTGSGGLGCSQGTLRPGLGVSSCCLNLPPGLVAVSLQPGETVPRRRLCGRLGQRALDFLGGTRSEKSEFGDASRGPPRQGWGHRLPLCFCPFG